MGLHARLRHVFAAAAFLAPAAALALACGGGGSASPSDASREGHGDASIEARGDGPTEARGDTGGSETDAGGAYLVELSVTGSTGMMLFPPFSPTTFDYYVRCSAGANALTVTMKAAPGATSALTQPTTSPRRAEQTVMVTAKENQAIVAEAIGGDDVAQYWVRCLPHDMPRWSWDTHPDAGSPPPGYYLLGNMYSATGESGYALVLDKNGVPVWYAKAPTGGNPVDVDNLKPDTISFDPFGAMLPGFPFELRDLMTRSTSFIYPKTYAPSIHELRRLPNGDYMILAAPLDEGVDLTGRTLMLGDGGTMTLGMEAMLDCTIVEFTPAGNVVWTWTASQHFGTQALTLLEPVFGGMPAPDGGILVDGYHCNSIDVDPANDNLLVSARDMDSIFYVDRASGRVLWKMGGANSSIDNAMYVNVSDPFFRQHDARLVPGFSSTCGSAKGSITVFDDESYVPGATARGVVYDVTLGTLDGGPPDDGGCAAADGGATDGGATGTATRTWQYRGTTRTVLAGSFRVSADGSRVIDWGVGGKANRTFTEVDVAQHDLLDFDFAYDDSSYRAIKVPTSTFAIGLLRQTAGLP